MFSNSLILTVNTMLENYELSDEKMSKGLQKHCQNIRNQILGSIDSLTKYFNYFRKINLKNKNTTYLNSTHSTEWIEIKPYGFLSRNYINYIQKKIPKNSVEKHSGNLKVVRFKDKSIIIETSNGSVIELDKSMRVVFVRLPKQSKFDLFESNVNGKIQFSNKLDEDGAIVINLQDQLTIKNYDDHIQILFKNGQEICGYKSQDMHAKQELLISQI